MLIFKTFWPVPFCLLFLRVGFDCSISLVCLCLCFGVKESILCKFYARALLGCFTKPSSNKYPKRGY